MANLPRKLQKIFGAGVAPTGNIGQFGSAAAGAPAYSGDLDQIQTARWLDAWGAALINAPGGLASPALQDMNAAFYVMTTQIAYILKKGMPDWLASEEYFIDDFVKVGGVVYISRSDNNTGNPPTLDANNWKTLQSTLTTSARAQAKAWVCFDGRTGAINDGYNVASVARTAAGCYLLTFTTPMANKFYAFAGSCGTANGVAWGVGDDNYICGGATGRVMVKTENQLSIFAIDRESLQDPSAVSIIIFGG